MQGTPTMTQNTIEVRSPRNTTTAQNINRTRKQAESMLNDIAFVLSMTQRIKEEMLAEQPIRETIER